MPMSVADSPERLSPSVAASPLQWWLSLARFSQRHPLTARVTALFLLSRCAYVLIGWVAVQVVPLGQGFHPLTDYAAWDSLHYLTIAQQGYTRALIHTNPAFFPLYPLLIAGSAWVLGGHFAFAALLVTNISWYLALLQLALLVHEDIAPRLVTPTILAYLLFPMAFFCFVPYPEAIYLACAIAAMRAIRHHRWALAALLGVGAALTRQVGVFLVLAFLWEYLSSHRQPTAEGHSARWPWRIQPDILWCVLIPCGTLLYSGWLWFAVGDPLAFVHAQATWHRVLTFPGAVVWLSFAAMFGPADPFTRFRLITDFFLVWASVGMAVAKWRMLPGSYLVYLIVVWLSFLSTPSTSWPLISQPRLMLEIFPVFIIFGALLLERHWLRIAAIAVSVPLQIALFTFFVRGGWIT